MLFETVVVATEFFLSVVCPQLFSVKQPKSKYVIKCLIVVCCVVCPKMTANGLQLPEGGGLEH